MPKGAFSLLNDESAYEKSLQSLDESQLKSVVSDEPNIVIRAPAGSGKTKTLIAAIIAYRYNNLNDKICAITYTRAACAEMEERLQQSGIYDVEVTTIHAWCRKRLLELSTIYDFPLNILQEGQIKIILTDIVKNYLLTHPSIRQINLDILYNYITNSKRMDITDNFRRTLNAIEERYINYKRSQVLYDFTDYPLYLLNVLKFHKASIKDIDALFVDEFQDVDLIQEEVFELVDAKKKFYIGDPRQSIYQFRNADGEVFNKLDNFQLLKLRRNYRSYQEIIDYATTVYINQFENYGSGYEANYITKTMFSQKSQIECFKGTGGAVYLIDPFSRIKKFGTNTFKTEDRYELFKQFMNLKPMILCRTNKQVNAIKNCNYFNVDTVHQAKGLEYDNVLVVDSNIDNNEDLNVAYVAMTRARNSLFVINWQQIEYLFKMFINKR